MVKHSARVTARPHDSHASASAFYFTLFFICTISKIGYFREFTLILYLEEDAPFITFLVSNVMNVSELLAYVRIFVFILFMARLRCCV